MISPTPSIPADGSLQSAKRQSEMTKPSFITSALEDSQSADREKEVSVSDTVVSESWNTQIEKKELENPLFESVSFQESVEALFSRKMEELGL